MPQPTTLRRASALTRTASLRRLVTYNPKIPSAGMTLTSPWGPVDLVAIERAVRGQDVTLSKPDRAWLANRTHYSYGRRLAADALGIEPERFRTLIRRWRRANLPAPTTVKG